MVAGVLAALLVAGAIIAFVGFGSSLANKEELNAPGEADVEFDANTDAAIYIKEGETGSAECSITGPDGENVPPDFISFTTSTLTVGGDEYILHSSFDADEAGTYEVSCDTFGGGEVPLLVGDKVDFGTFGGVLLGILLLILALVAVLAIVLPVALKRSSNKKKLQMERFMATGGAGY